MNLSYGPFMVKNRPFPAANTLSLVNVAPTMSPRDVAFSLKNESIFNTQKTTR
jgi:hypothetical protein